MQIEMEIGDRVAVIDGSYSKHVDTGRLEDSCGLELKACDLVLIATGCSLPAGSCCPEPQVNDTIVQDLRTGDVYFTQLRFVRIFCPHCGEVIF